MTYSLFRLLTWTLFLFQVFAAPQPASPELTEANFFGAQTAGTNTPESNLTTTNTTLCGLPATYSDCDSSPRSWKNCNEVVSGIYPIVENSQDPPYSVPESFLREAIHIPSTFDTNKTAVILFPGTGLPTYDIYKDTLIPLLQQDGLNPIWINPSLESTQFSTADAQLTAEYAAYAISYMHAYTNRKVVVVGASQGSMNIQWALKYWRSTRAKVADFVVLSGDFKGTSGFGPPLPIALVVTLCGPPCYISQALWQQIRGSRFEKALNAGNGDSALVPTTSIWSDQDQIISPHSTYSSFLTSAMLRDDFDVGFKGVILQEVCRRSPIGNLKPPTGIGTFYSHFGAALHPLTYALVTDAITNDGPADLKRIGDVQKLCGQDGKFEERLGPEAGVLEPRIGALSKCLSTSGRFKHVGNETDVREYASRPA